MSKWFVSNMAPSGGTPTISILNDIGMWGVNAEMFLAEARRVSVDSNDLIVEINSRGGDLIQAIAIYNGLRALGKTVHTKVLGCAASAASYIFMAGSVRTMPANGFLMVHQPRSAYTMGDGTADDHRNVAEALDKFHLVVKAGYATPEMDDEKLTAILSKDTYLTADEALALGLATAVGGALEVTAAFDVEDMPENVQKAFKAVAQAPVAQTPVAQAPVAQTPVAQTPVAQAPVAQAPVAQAPGTFTDSIVARLAAEGLQAVSSEWVMNIVDEVTLTTAIANAREISSLFRVLNRSDEALAFIAKNMPLAEVKAKLLEKGLSEEIDSILPISNPNEGARPSGDVTAATIWAARNKQQGNM